MYHVDIYNIHDMQIKQTHKQKIHSCSSAVYYKIIPLRLFLGDAWLLDITSLQWSVLTQFPNDRPRLWHTACVSPQKEVIVFGGCGNNILEDEEESLVVCIFCLSHDWKIISVLFLCIRGLLWHRNSFFSLCRITGMIFCCFSYNLIH